MPKTICLRPSLARLAALAVRADVVKNDAELRFAIFRFGFAGHEDGFFRDGFWFDVENFRSSAARRLAAVKRADAEFAVEPQTFAKCVAVESHARRD